MGVIYGGDDDHYNVDDVEGKILQIIQCSYPKPIMKKILQRYRSVLRKLASKHFRTDEKKTALLGQSIAVKHLLAVFLVTIQL